jgi:paraquat-inducible protein A
MNNSPVKYSVKEKIFRILFILVLLPVAGYAGWCGYTIYNLSAERAALKKDYSEVNNIQYGLLSVDRWRDNITEIVSAQIEDFELSGMQEDTLKKEINKILNALISQADEMINEKQKNIGSKLKKFAFKTFVNVDKIRERVPEFSETIISQIKKPRSKERLKFLAQDKLNDFAEQTRDSITGREYVRLLAKYNTVNADDLNKIITVRAEVLQQKSYDYTFRMLGIMFFFLLMWLVARKAIVLHTPLFIISVILALIFLFTGLAAPMIEIDARIQEINFMLIGKNIEFHDQVLFYQSKSIIDVVKILIATGKADSVFVGLLILVFSIIFPVCKLLSTKIHLLGSQKWRNSKIIKFFAFKSGKWSMADVMVVAIFMAYIGFKGILDSQLGSMNRDMNNQYVASIATNKTSLQPGIILFIAFVLFGLILSAILNKISPKNKEVITTEIN